MERHADRLKMGWSHHLDSNRGKAINQTNHDECFDPLEKTIDGVDTDCIWAATETGFQPGIGTQERVIGRKGRKATAQQRNGSWKNITVIVTIGGDGDAIAPGVIFKGQAFLTRWGENNPLNASYVYQTISCTKDI